MTLPASDVCAPPVFFDVGDTLIFARRTLHEQVVRICREAGRDVDTIFLRHTAAEFARSVPRATSVDQQAYEAWWRQMYRHLLKVVEYPGALDEAEDELWAAWRNGTGVRLFPDTRQALDRLRGAGVRMGVVSNWDDSFETILERLEIADYFEVCVASYQMGVEKPDSRLFEAALAGMGAVSGTPWYVGDRIEKDVEGAQAVGWRPILVDYFDHHTDVQENGYPLVTSLDAAVDIILGDTSIAHSTKAVNRNTR